MKFTVELNFQVVAYPEQVGPDTAWIAQCVERDIVANGSSPDEAINNLRRIVSGEVAIAINRIPPTPEHVLSRAGDIPGATYH